MKMPIKKLLPLTLAALMLFTGCAAGQANAAQADHASSETAAVQAAQADHAESGSAVTLTVAGAGSSTAAQESDAFAEAFSKRDLSGEYDAAEAVSIELTGTGAVCEGDGVSVSGSVVTITAEGVYLLSGTLENGSIIVDAGKEDKVQLVLDGVSVNADDFAAIYVRQADKVFITLAEGTVNTLSNGGAFTQIDENDVDAVVFAKDDVTFNGAGTLRIDSPAGHGVSGKDEVTFTNGVYEITAANHAVRAKDSLAVADGNFTLTAGKDGLHAENGDDDTLGNIYIAGGSFSVNAADDGIHATALLEIDGGSIDITAAEGLEATVVRINDGTIHIAASDDGVNAAQKSSAYTPTVEINGGAITIEMGAGDVDGVDSNGDLIINGGTVDVTARSPFDYDGTAQYNGGTIIVNGQQVDGIPNQMMGGGMGGMRGGMEGGMPGDMNGGVPGGMRGGMNGGMPGGKGGWEDRQG